MTNIPVQLPLKGFTEQTPFSVVPEGMTASCLNVMPLDVWTGRTRLSVRSGTQLYNAGDVQWMGTYRVYVSGVLVENIIFVRAGKVYTADPHASIPVTATLAFGQGAALLNTTGLVEGVQFNEYFYFVDGTNYVKVLLTDLTATGATVWGSPSGPIRGPWHLDPASSPEGSRATLICRWGARVVLAGFDQTPNLWFACTPDLASAVSGPTDGWDAAEVIGAVTGTTGNEYGTLGDPIVAIFAFGESGLMFACTNSFSFLTTDPLFTTELVALVSLTRSIGISGRRAWCMGQEKSAFILANDGLYLLNANDFNFTRANRVSSGRLDSFFLRLDFGTPSIGGSSTLSGGTLRSTLTSGGSGSGATAKTQTTTGTLSEDATTTSISMETDVLSLLGPEVETGEIFPCLVWDPDREGVWMFLTVKDIESTSIHLYYDTKTDSFWPQRFRDPLMYGPTSACYVGTSRNESGKLLLGGSESISLITNKFPIGIDGFDMEMSEADQQAQFVRSHVTIGPLSAPLPYRLMLNEVRVDLNENSYELPSGFTDLSVGPILSVSTGETAEAALGLQSDSLFITNINPLVIDGGSATTVTFANTYDGGTVSAPTPDRIDGRFAVRPFGLYTQTDPFAFGISRVYVGESGWTMRWDTQESPATGSAWVIEKYNNATTLWEIEYQGITDVGSTNGTMTSIHEDPIAPEVVDNASVSGASFPTAEVTEIGLLGEGRSVALKCRHRAEAMYLTLASDGRPWSIERMSISASQTGKSRGSS